MPGSVSVLTHTRQGAITGRLDPATGIAGFFGLPYAAAPVGPLRFEHPAPPAGWTGVRDVTSFGPRCEQRKPFPDMVFRSKATSEDCLTLNVWTPRPCDGRAMLPVLLYVHGGAFLVGDGSEPRHDGAALAGQDIVVVTANFRLGVFGFLVHPELETANAGLMDLCAALAWLRENLTAFGGDPDRITIAGSSSGAYAVCALLCSPLTIGAVAGVIMHSASLLGAGLSGLDTRLPPLEEARSKGHRLGVSLGAASLRELKGLEAMRLLEMGSTWNTPLVDGVLLTGHVIDLIEQGHAPCVPVLAGIVSAERSFDTSVRIDRLDATAFHEILARRYGDAAPELFAAYGSPRTTHETRRAAQDLLSDEWTGVGTFRLCAAMSARGAPVFSYVFDHPRPAPSPGSGGWTTSDGAGHSTDIEYFLGTQSLSDAYDWTDQDRALSARMTACLAAFVKTGDPNAAGHPAWPDFRDGQRIVLSPKAGTRDVAATALLARLRAGSRTSAAQRQSGQPDPHPA